MQQKDKSQNYVLSEGNQAQNSMHRTIPFILGSGIGKIYLWWWKTEWWLPSRQKWGLMGREQKTTFCDDWLFTQEYTFVITYKLCT